MINKFHNYSINFLEFWNILFNHFTNVIAMANATNVEDYAYVLAKVLVPLQIDRDNVSFLDI